MDVTTDLRFRGDVVISHTDSENWIFVLKKTGKENILSKAAMDLQPVTHGLQTTAKYNV